MKNIHLSHPFDCDSAPEELDLFVEEVHGAEQHDLPPNSLSTLACECELSTFFCYGCGLLTAEPKPAQEKAAAADDIEGLEEALRWTREKLDTAPADDKVAEVLRTVVQFRRGS